jgi:hypothetical protein
MGFHPTARGFGWTVLESPLAVVEAGTFEHKQPGRKNENGLHRLGRLLDRFTPETLVLEAFDKQSSLRSARIRKLCLAAVALAADRGVEIVVYKRAETRKAFAAQTRDDIAEAVLRTLPALQVHYPGRRRPWEGEAGRLAIFTAAALVLTHFHAGANRVFEDRSAA